MRALIFVITIAIVAFMITTELRDPPEHMMTERDKIERFLKDYTFNTPAQVIVLHEKEVVDNQTRERVKTLVLKTNEEYLPMSPRIPDQSQRVLVVLKQTLPEYDFGNSENETASYFQWLSSNAEWKVSSLQTTNGFFSLWEKRSDVYQLTQ